ncbi:hypothetical protein ZYGR_0AK06490 [Zygosaccharomyces rouxii]|uniref:SHSP domain-containing protein n=1 Tax=Zygosaccharomyces rouxii TaxID=4956 RepID=A0A1Q3AEJ0_ZYGRO|nr:hypothetical protein ZYGR_0AK06490 [Zygosaccharomyces rouxii]
MSFNSPFFSFFDAINNEVENFNRVLDNSGFNYYYPSRHLSTVKKSNDKSLQKNYDDSRWFDDWSLLPTRVGSEGIIPAVDLLEHEKNYELNITIPGVKDKKDINLEYHKEPNQIIVSGEIPPTVTEENKDKVRVREVASGKFKRVITLPKTPGVDADNITADYTDGILKLNVPKLEPTEPENQVKKIEVSSKL